MKYAIQYGLEICIMIAGTTFMRVVAGLLMCLTSYALLRRTNKL